MRAQCAGAKTARHAALAGGDVNRIGNAFKEHADRVFGRSLFASARRRVDGHLIDAVARRRQRSLILQAAFCSNASAPFLF